MLGHKVLFSTKLNKENITTISKYKVAGSGPASKLRAGGNISNIRKSGLTTALLL